MTKTINNLCFILVFCLFSCVTSKKEVTQNQLHLFEKVKVNLKFSKEFQEFKTDFEIDCEGMEVSNFLAKPCYYYHYLDSTFKSKLSYLNCDTESDNWGESYTNLSSLSDLGTNCLIANFSEIINKEYIFMEISENTKLNIYTSKLFIFRIEENGLVRILNSLDLLHE